MLQKSSCFERRELLNRSLFLVLVASMSVSAASRSSAQQAPETSPLHYTSGTLVCRPNVRGDLIPDFSHAGYAGGENAPPSVAARIVVLPAKGDATRTIQKAIDTLAEMPLGANGFRGAVQLLPGDYEIGGQLLIQESGIVLRGSGAAEGGTRLIATGQDRRALIRIVGTDDRIEEDPVRIAQSYVPTGAVEISLPAGHGFVVGDRIRVTRPSTEAWIASLGTDNFGGDRHGPKWRAGSRNLVWDRKLVAVDPQTITLDTPVTTAIDEETGGGTVARYEWPGRIRNVGVENLLLESAVNPHFPLDEDHAWCGITIENACDIWVRQIDLKHFAGYGIAVWESAKRVTVEDSKSLAPVSEIGGGRRVSFFTSGQQVLMQRL